MDEIGYRKRAIDIRIPIQAREKDIYLSFSADI